MTISEHLLKHNVTPGQDPDAVYKYYETYLSLPWPFHKLVITNCGYVLDLKALVKNEQFQQQLEALSKLKLNGE